MNVKSNNINHSKESPGHSINSHSSLSAWHRAYLDDSVENSNNDLKGTSKALEESNDYRWYIKEEFGDGSFERFHFTNLSFTRMRCKFTRKLDFSNEYSSDQLGFHIILSGESYYEFYDLNEKITVKSPQIWIQNGILGKFRIIIPSDQTLKKISIFINKDYLKELYGHHNDNLLLHYLIKNNHALFQPLPHVPSKVFELTNALLELPCATGKLAQMNVQGQCLTLVSMLLSNGLNNRAKYIQKDSLARCAALKVKIYIDNNPSDNMTIKELAHFSGTNTCYLKYEFKTLTTFTIYQYRQQARMQLALRLLGDSRKSLHIIALQLGFNSTDYFIKVFKAYFGQHPKAFN